MKVSTIRVGNRHRQHIGDVRTLADSTAKLGLLHPIVVDGNRRMVAGARRLAAVRLLGWTGGRTQYSRTNSPFVISQSSAAIS